MSDYEAAGGGPLRGLGAAFSGKVGNDVDGDKGDKGDKNKNDGNGPESSKKSGDGAPAKDDAGGDKMVKETVLDKTVNFAKKAAQKTATFTNETLNGPRYPAADDAPKPLPLPSGMLPVSNATGLKRLGMLSVPSTSGPGMNDMLSHIRSASKNGDERSIGLILIGLVYVLGWTNGYNNAIGACTTKETCTTFAVMLHLLGAMFRFGLVAMCILALVCIVYYLIVVPLFTFVPGSMRTEDGDGNGGGDGSKKTLSNGSICIRILFSWADNVRLLLSVASAMVATAVFAFLMIRWTDKQNVNLPPQDRIPYSVVVQHIFVFNLFMVVAMVVAQMWADRSWNSPYDPSTSARP